MVTREHISEKVLPCLAIRGSVPFPKIPINIDVGRAISRKAVDAAMANDGIIMMVCQKEQSVDNPGPNDLYKIGTTAKITQKIRENGGSYRIITEPIYRAEIKEFIENSKYIEVDVFEKEIYIDNRSVKAEALLKDLRTSIIDFISMIPKFSSNIKNLINSIDDLSTLCDLVGSNIVASVEDKQALLEEFNPMRRAEKLMIILEKEKELIETEERIQKKVRSKIDRSQREYYLREQMKAISDELGEGGENGTEASEYEKKIAALKTTEEVKDKLRKEVKKLGKVPYGSAEASVISTYLDTVLSIPFGIRTKDRMDIPTVQKILDKDHDGLKEVKDRIVEYIAALKLNPSLKNQIICLVGAPGTGKTSVASSIARALNRKFVRISLGGIRDEADIRGHRKTYIGSMPGRIINAVITAGTQNPVILMDEVDKLTRDAHGDPASALLEVLDTEQNKSFRDHYIEVPIDLSDCLFITTANTLDSIPDPLLDRMEIISMKIYTRSEKLGIAKNHLIPKQSKIHGLTSKTFKMTDDAVLMLIDTYVKEAGVRNLERYIAKCCRRAAKQISCNETNAVKITTENLAEYADESKLIKDKILDDDEIGTICGMAYTEIGGEIMHIEVLSYDGTGRIELTGSLGEVMKEASHNALSYVKSKSDELGIDPEVFKSKDIHINFPEGAVPKDGPSAGVATAIAITSELTGIPVKRDVAVTGEITLRGRVLPIGGLREKTMAAYLAGVKTIIIPSDNKIDEKDIMDEVKENVDIEYVSKVEDALRIALTTDPFENAKEKSGKSDVISMPAKKAGKRANLVN